LIGQSLHDCFVTIPPELPDNHRPRKTGDFKPMLNRKLSFRFAVVTIFMIAISTLAIVANWGGGLRNLVFAESADSGMSENVAGSTAVIFGGPTCSTAGPIEVAGSTVGTTPTAYATLKDAFDAVNAGTHQGAITIEVCGDTTEAASAVLNSGEIAPAVYTSVNIIPVGAARSISGNIVGAVV
jgi:hypothetical protein